MLPQKKEMGWPMEAGVLQYLGIRSFASHLLGRSSIHGLLQDVDRRDAKAELTYDRRDVDEITKYRSLIHLLGHDH